MEMLIEKQADGYRVDLDGEGLVIGAKKVQIHVSHFGEFAMLSEVVRTRYADRITDESGLWASPAGLGLYRVRDIGDALVRVREIQEVAARAAAERDAKNAAAAQVWLDADEVLVCEQHDPELARLIALIPADGVRVTTVAHNNGDAGSYNSYAVEDLEISHTDLVFVGWASATRPGALAAFKSTQVVYILRARLAELCADHDAVVAKADEKRLVETQRIDDVFAEARRSGERQKLRGWMTEECWNGNDMDCSFDSATEWAMPDGSRTVTYNCCY